MSDYEECGSNLLVFCLLYFQAQEMEAVCCFETSEITRSTLRYYLEDSVLTDRTVM
jgi:hypothetical protein